MSKIEFIGNLGADARIEEYQGRKFVSFNVADTESYTDQQGNKQEKTQWISCTLQGDGGNLLPYLKKGKTVFIRGYMSTRVFNSAKYRAMVAGVNCSVREIELVGGQVREVPRQLNDDSGLLYEVYQAFYIDPSIKKKPKELIDSQMNRYAVDKHGFITRIVTTDAAQTQTDNTADPNNDPNAPVF